MKYILKSTPKILNDIDNIRLSEIENKIKDNKPMTKEDIEYFLDIIVFRTRCKFSDNLEEYSFEYKCDTAQSIICFYLNDLQVKNNPCMTQNVITNDIVGHSFITAIFNLNGMMVPYLIDPTYRQFFEKSKCNESNYILYKNKIIVKTPDPGYFIKDEDKETIISFLYNGYSLMDEYISRIYGDSFYNTKVGINVKDKEFKSIPGSIYLNAFLKGNEKLSKSKETLEEESYLIEPIQQKKM